MRLYGLDIKEVGEGEESMVRRLFPARYARAERIIKREDRLACIAAGALIHAVLGVEESGLSRTPEGKPYIEGGPGFCVSHSGGRCVLAVGQGRIGVDIEKLDEDNLLAAPAALTQEELEWIKASPLERFHILWTRKESIYKAVGGYTDPKQIPSLDGRLPTGLFVESTIIEGFAISLCSDTERPGPINILGI